MKINPGNKTPRVITATEAARLVKSGDWLDYGSTLVQPDLFDHALAARKAMMRGFEGLRTSPQPATEIPDTGTR